MPAFGPGTRLGPRFAMQASPQPSASGPSPTDPLSIVTSVAPFFFLSADVGVTVATGVSSWADQSGNGRNAVQATTASQPALQPAAVNGRGSVLFDGTDDFLQIAYVPPAPGTTPAWYWMVFRPITAVTGSNSFSSGNSRPRFYWQNASLMNANAGVAGTGIAVTAGQWYRAELFFNNATTDYKKIGASSNTGISLGNLAGAGSFLLGSGNSGSNPSNVEIVCFGAWAGEPTPAEKAALDAWVTAYYGASVQT